MRRRARGGLPEEPAAPPAAVTSDRAPRMEGAPGGGSPAEGGSPASSRARRIGGAGSATAAMSAAVYGWSGRSMIGGRPFLDDASQIEDGDAVGDAGHHGDVVGDEEVGETRALAQFESRFTICAATDTSSAETGSSHTTRRGSVASALAIATRCRCPPESSDGNRGANSGARPTLGAGLATRAAAACRGRLHPQRLRDLVADAHPRIQGGLRVLEDHLQLSPAPAQRLPASASQSSPSKSIGPRPVDQPRDDRPAVVLPLPDSPTRPRASLSEPTSKLIPRSAGRSPLGPPRTPRLHRVLSSRARRAPAAAPECRARRASRGRSFVEKAAGVGAVGLRAAAAPLARGEEVRAARRKGAGLATPRPTGPATLPGIASYRSPGLRAVAQTSEPSAGAPAYRDGAARRSDRAVGPLPRAFRRSRRARDRGGARRRRGRA